jgi:aminobenzoyl-glutamate utilization protein B
MAGSTLDLLTKPELLKKAKEEHEEKMKGRVYRCPIPADINPPLEMARATATRLRGKD